MKTLTQQLSQYAAYHRDRRNVMTHFVGIPMILLAATILLDRPTFVVGDWFISPALVIAIALTVYYLVLDLRYGLVMGVILALSLMIAGDVADGDRASWLGWGIGLFVVGWIIQFVGHHYEGRKPAFLDDVMGLAIGPLFVVAEAGFLFGLRKEVEAQIQGGFSPSAR
jgi:uncharacterized membrane protein YGL010W